MNSITEDEAKLRHPDEWVDAPAAWLITHKGYPDRRLSFSEPEDILFNEMWSWEPLYRREAVTQETDVSMLVAEWKAENAGLRAAWEQAVVERDAAKAEIARLQRENSDLHHNIVGMRSSNTNLVAERDAAKAEIARLSAENQRFKALIKSETAWLRSLGPKESDDAKAEIARLQGYNAALTDEITRLAPHRTALKPDTGELVDYVEFTDGTSLIGEEATAFFNRKLP